MAHIDQHGIPCTYIRGGTSKALFFREIDLPPPGLQRDVVLKRVMGSPDSYQIDGMGGCTTHTSKVAIIGPPTVEDADVDFTFAQVGIDEDSVSYKGNCGNISAAVGAFAIDEGLLTKNRKGYSTDAQISAREVHIYNTNTKKILISQIPIDARSGYSITSGTAIIAGVPGTSAPILMDYRNTIGGTRANGLLPSGRVIDLVSVGDKDVEISICDVANISIIVRAEDVGLSGTESAIQITKNPAVVAKCKEIRGKGAQIVGMCKDWRMVDEETPGLPFVTLVAPPSSTDADMNVRVMFQNKCHDTMPGTGAVCLAACSRTPGTVAAGVLGSGHVENGVFRIHHPAGLMSIWVKAVVKTSPLDVSFNALSFERTARRIMAGTIFVPKTVWSGPKAIQNGTAK